MTFDPYFNTIQCEYQKIPSLCTIIMSNYNFILSRLGFNVISQSVSQSEQRVLYI